MLSRLSRLLLHSSTSSRDLLSKNNLTNEASNSFKLFRGLTTQTGAIPKFGSSAKIFAPYTLFKGKAALSADPLRPTFSKLESGDYRVERRGVIILTFWPAIGERKYDWDKRQKFALSATEVGNLIAWDSSSTDSCEFFHDPSMLSSNAGQVRKSFSIKAHAGGTGYFFNLNVVNNVLKTNDRFTVPVTPAEFAVMRTAFTFALPHIMGWDQCTNQLPLRSNQIPPATAVPDLRPLSGIDEFTPMALETMLSLFFLPIVPRVDVHYLMHFVSSRQRCWWLFLYYITVFL